MSMTKRVEQRWNERRPVEFEVELTAQGQSPLRAICRDLGFGGMYVEANSRTFSVNEGLEVDLSLGETEPQMRQHLPARVVRVNAQGAGLMFSGFKLENVRALRAVIYGDDGVARHARG
ncbi:MAG: PilZ domain-containing protein [Gammaproteobacteria bacterium]|nr:PilZ domain-containing protein [Gammaproteobacteria bacterium]